MGQKPRRRDIPDSLPKRDDRASVQPDSARPRERAQDAPPDSLPPEEPGERPADGRAA